MRWWWCSIMTTKELAKYEPEAAETAATLALAAAEALDESVRSMAIASASAAVQMAKQIKARRVAFEKQRDDYSKPLRALATKHSKCWNPSIKVYEALEKHLKNVALELELIEQAQQQRALAAASTAEEVAAASEPVDSGLGKSTTWTWELVDYSLVPEEYKVLDKSLIDKEARALKDKLDIPGIRPVPKVTGVLR